MVSRVGEYQSFNILIFFIENLPVSFTLLRNLPVNNAFSNIQTQASNCPSTENMLETSAQNVSPTVTSDVIIGQVGATRRDWNSLSLQTNPIGLNFTFETTQSNISDYSYHYISLCLLELLRPVGYVQL